MGHDDPKERSVAIHMRVASRYAPRVHYNRTGKAKNRSFLADWQKGGDRLIEDDAGTTLDAFVSFLSSLILYFFFFGFFSLHLSVSERENGSIRTVYQESGKCLPWLSAISLATRMFKLLPYSLPHAGLTVLGVVYARFFFFFFCTVSVVSPAWRIFYPLGLRTPRDPLRWLFRSFPKKPGQPVRSVRHWFDNFARPIVQQLEFDFFRVWNSVRFRRFGDWFDWTDKYWISL